MGFEGINIVYGLDLTTPERIKHVKTLGINKIKKMNLKKLMDFPSKKFHCMRLYGFAVIWWNNCTIKY